MSKFLETIVKELNPLHDFDRFKFYKLGEITLEADQDKRFERIRSNGRFLLWIPKNVVRGIVIGAAFGGYAGIMSDDLNSYRELYSVLAGSGYIGFQIDTVQYLIRGIYHLFKGE